ncbi:MAG: type I restriction-modification system subunit M N-terminal domain-containing protein [Bacteroidia bacterium]
MSENHKKHLERQLWNIADALRSKMNADEYRNYILGFIFFKYLSERMLDFANEQLQRAPITSYNEVPEDESTEEGKRYMETMRQKALKTLGYFLKPSQLFSTLVARGMSQGTSTEVNEDEEVPADNFILEDLRDVLRYIENSTQGTDSEKDFINLFQDINLDSVKLGRSVEARNKIIVDVLRNLSKIDFRLDDVDSDVLGDAYEYLIGEFASGAGKKAGEFYTPHESPSLTWM